MFNNYAWSLYLKSSGGEIVTLFNNVLSGNLTHDIILKIAELRSYYFLGKISLEDESKQLEDMVQYIHSFLAQEAGDPDVFYADEESYIDDINEIYNEFYLNLSNDGQYNSKTAFEEFVAGLSFYSTLLAILYPGLFVPYFFRLNFNIFSRISKDFEIELPVIPAKKDYKGRFFYYKDVCIALKDFQHNHNLSDAELCAFLYDFAPKYIGGKESYIIMDELPKAKNAFFIGGTKDDAFLTDDPNAVTIWQCNPDTRVGDMIVMYIRTPVSAICSIWQSLSIGFNDPFFYYYHCTYIGNPVQIKPITLDELHNDELLSKMWIVRKNMQGINGVELKPSEYNRILELADCKLPRLEYEVPENDSNFKREKDVENMLVKPLLKQLGYEEIDYVQQLYFEIGNHNHALIPDFVLLPKIVHGQRTAYAVLEAKLSIINPKQLHDALSQARSYSKLLGAKYQMIASKEQLWLFSAKDDFSNEILSTTWEELKNPDTFALLYKILRNK